MLFDNVALFQNDHSTASWIEISKVRGDRLRVDIERSRDLDIAAMKTKISTKASHWLHCYLRWSFGQNDTNDSLINSHVLDIFNKVDVEDVFATLGLVNVGSKISVEALIPGIIPSAKERVARSDLQNWSLVFISKVWSRHVSNFVTEIRVASRSRQIKWETLQYVGLIMQMASDLILNSVEISVQATYNKWIIMPTTDIHNTYRAPSLRKA